jgi:hypothetical protein
MKISSRDIGLLTDVGTDSSAAGQQAGPGGKQGRARIGIRPC